MPNNVIGTDGKSPIYQPDGRWAIWALSEVYTGQQGAGKYVPKVNDYVINPDTDQRFKVTALDPTTLIATLSEIIPVALGELTKNDILLGVGPGTISDTHRVYIDQSVTPHLLCVDARLYFPGTKATKVMIFKGSELTGDQAVVSALYDQNGTLLGQAIPLETISAPIGNTTATMKTIPVCHTLADLPDNTLLTVVAYDVNDVVIYKGQLLVENTAFIRGTNAAVKYITGITMESPFITAGDPMTVKYPINVPLEGLSLTGVVHYNDGTTLKLPVDGTKFRLFGFEGFIATEVGQKFPLVLKYTLSPGEVAYGTNSVGGDFITAAYNAVTLAVDGAYSVKLFGYPVWIDAVNGYRMEWFLYTLNRDIVYRVTPYVKIDPASVAYNPTGYGIVQNLLVYINMSDANAAFTPYKHVQHIAVTLKAPPSDRTTPWTVGYVTNQNPLYGDTNAHATISANTGVNQTVWNVRLLPDELLFANWINRLYSATMPLTDPLVEAAPPAPTHFALVINNQDVEFPIAAWNSDLAISSNLPDNSTLFVKFLAKTPQNTMQLAVAGLTVWHL